MTLLLLVAACVSSGPDDTAAPFVETLDPDEVHVIATAIPSLADDPAIADLSADLQVRWAWHMENGGALGAVRLPDGATVFASSRLPPDYTSGVEKIDKDGENVWSYFDLFTGGLGFSHGVVPTPAGDWIALDSSGARLVSFDEGGTVLWEWSLLDLPLFGTPNGVSLREEDDGALLAITMLQRSESAGQDSVAILHIGDRLSPPTLVSCWDLATDLGANTWPHGPLWQPDGSLLLHRSALGEILAPDMDGNELWTLPPPERAGTLAFPRSSTFLPDGSLVVADAGLEVLRVWDPFGAFEVVHAIEMPGVFSVEAVTCGAGGGLPCLSD